MRERQSAIIAREIRKRYKGAAEGTGLNGFNLTAREGTIHGLLGPNGAGKTTAVRILTTLLAMDSGEAWVAGCDVRTQGQQVRQRIGLVGQSAALDEILSGRQNLELFARLNHLPGREAKQRASDLLERFGLAETGRKPVSDYSGGMRRRLDLAASLIVAPAVLFVDEPTTGLDPLARREVWTAIRNLAGSGATVLLTTQYLEEADQLADRISMLKDGVVIAEGSPRELKANLGGNWLDLTLRSPGDLPLAQQILARLSPEVQCDENALRLSIPVEEGTRALIQATTALHEAGVAPLDISLRQPTLDEVFIHLNAEQPRPLEVSA